MNHKISQDILKINRRISQNILKVNHDNTLSSLSGTNDKAGGPHYMLKWASPQVKQIIVMTMVHDAWCMLHDTWCIMTDGGTLDIMTLTSYSNGWARKWPIVKTLSYKNNLHLICKRVPFLIINCNPQAVKQTFVPLPSVSYPYMNQ